jgi:hypothetical protein
MDTDTTMKIKSWACWGGCSTWLMHIDPDMLDFAREKIQTKLPIYS